MASMIAKDRAYTRHRLPKEWTLDASKLALRWTTPWTPRSAPQLMQMADASGWKPSPMAPLQTGLRARFDNDAWARTIHERLRPFCPPVHRRRRLVGVTPTFRFVKYPEGASVAPHPDARGGDKHACQRANVSVHYFTVPERQVRGCETCLLPSPKSAPPPENPRRRRFSGGLLQARYTSQTQKRHGFGV